MLLGWVDHAPVEGPEGIEPALLALLKACAGAGQWQLAKVVLEGAPERGLPASVAAANEVITACAARGMAAEVG